MPTWSMVRNIYSHCILLLLTANVKKNYPIAIVWNWFGSCFDGLVFFALVCSHSGRCYSFGFSVLQSFDLFFIFRIVSLQVWRYWVQIIQIFSHQIWSGSDTRLKGVPDWSIGQVRRGSKSESELPDLRVLHREQTFLSSWDTRTQTRTEMVFCDCVINILRWFSKDESC